MTDTRDKYIFEIDVKATGQAVLREIGAGFDFAKDRGVAAIKAINAESGRLAAGVQAFGRDMFGQADSLVNFAAGLFTAEKAAEGFRTAFEGLASVVEAGMEIERYERQFTVLLGTAEAAQQKLVNLRDFTNTYGLDFHGVVDAARELETVGIDSGRAINILGNVAVTTGRSMEQLARALAGLQRGNLRGFLELIPAGSSAVVAAEADMFNGVHKSASQLRTLVSMALNDLSKQYDGSLALFVDSTESRLGQIKSRWEKLREDIYQSAVGGAFSDLVGNILDELGKLQKDGTIRQFVEGFAASMATAVKVATWLSDAVGPLIATMKALAVAFAIGAGVVILTEAVAGFTTVAAFASLALAGGLIPTIGAATVGMGAFGVALRVALGPVGLLTIAITALYFGFTALRESMRAPFKFKVEDETDYDEVHAKLNELKQQRFALINKQANEGKWGQTPAGKAINTKDLADLDKEIKTATRLDALNYAQNWQGPEQPRPNKDNPDPTDRKEFDRKAAELEHELSLQKGFVDRGLGLYADGVKRRLVLMRDERGNRLNALTEAQNAELQAFVASGEMRKQLETELEQDITARRDAIMANRTASPAIKADALRKLENERRAGMEQIAILSTTGAMLTEIERKNAEDRKKAGAVGDAEQRAYDIDNVIKGEQRKRQEYHLTTTEHLRNLGLVLNGTERNSIEEKRVLDEITSVENEQADEYVKAMYAKREAFNAFRDRLIAGGMPVEDVDKYAATLQQMSDFEAKWAQDNANTLDLAATRFEEYFARILGVSNLGYEQMTEFQRVKFNTSMALTKFAMSANEALVRGATARMTTEFSNYFRHRVTSEAFVAAVAKSAAREAAAVGLDVLSELMKKESLYYQAKAVAYGALGLHAQALKFQAAAFILRVGAVAASAGAGVMREQDASEQAQYDASRMGSAYDRATGGAAGKPTSTSLAVSQGNQPVTMNFYISESFAGGIYFFGRDGATELVNQIIPSLQRALDNRQLVVH